MRAAIPEDASPAPILGTGARRKRRRDSRRRAGPDHRLPDRRGESIWLTGKTRRRHRGIRGVRFRHRIRAGAAARAATCRRCHRSAAAVVWRPDDRARPAARPRAESDFSPSASSPAVGVRARRALHLPPHPDGAVRRCSATTPARASARCRAGTGGRGIVKGTVFADRSVRVGARRPAQVRPPQRTPRPWWGCITAETPRGSSCTGLTAGGGGTRGGQHGDVVVDVAGARRRARRLYRKLWHRGPRAS